MKGEIEHQRQTGLSTARHSQQPQDNAQRQVGKRKET